MKIFFNDEELNTSNTCLTLTEAEIFCTPESHSHGVGHLVDVRLASTGTECRPTWLPNIPSLHTNPAKSLSQAHASPLSVLSDPAP